MTVCDRFTVIVCPETILCDIEFYVPRRGTPEIQTGENSVKIPGRIRMSWDGRPE